MPALSLPLLKQGDENKVAKQKKRMELEKAFLFFERERERGSGGGAETGIQ